MKGCPLILKSIFPSLPHTLSTCQSVSLSVLLFIDNVQQIGTIGQQAFNWKAASIMAQLKLWAKIVTANIKKINSYSKLLYFILWLNSVFEVCCAKSNGFYRWYNIMVMVRITMIWDVSHENLNKTKWLSLNRIKNYLIKWKQDSTIIHIELFVVAKDK